MSVKGIQEVLSRAMGDAAFADALIADPDQALTGFDLTADEIAKFKGMSLGDLNAMSGLAPEERKSMAFARKAGEKPLE